MQQQLQLLRVCLNDNNYNYEADTNCLELERLTDD